MVPDGGQLAKIYPPENPARRPGQRVAQTVRYRGGFLKEVGHKPAAKIQMLPPKPLAGRHVPFASWISRRGMTYGCYLVKVNTGSTKPVSTRGYWSYRARVHCAAKVCNVQPPLFRINLLYTDFVALENMISGRSEDQHGVLENDYDHGHRPLSTSGRGRFSRYLRFATRGRGSSFRHEHQMYYDPTYPPASTQQDERN